MDFDYFYGRGADQFAFYQIPKILITDEKFAGITMESKILYSLMLDRASLSAKNGWLLVCFFRTLNFLHLLWGRISQRIRVTIKRSLKSV